MLSSAISMSDLQQREVVLLKLFGLITTAVANQYSFLVKLGKALYHTLLVNIIQIFIAAGYLVLWSSQKKIYILICM